MLAKLQKWGNSQGLRFSRTILRQAKLAPGDAVDISAKAGMIFVKPAAAIRGKYQLKDLLAKMPENYKPGEADWSGPQGKEVW